MEEKERHTKPEKLSEAQTEKYEDRSRGVKKHERHTERQRQKTDRKRKEKDRERGTGEGRKSFRERDIKRGRERDSEG